MDSRFTLSRPDGQRLACYRWSNDRPPRAILVVAHGMGEHALRYRPALARLIDSVERYRNDQAVAKKPGLAEVIDAMAVLAAPPSGRDRWHIVRSALAKTRDDRQIWDSLFHSGPQAAS